jgi:DNA-binding response OmpR family regulator
MRICVVEDELRVLRFLEQALRGEGHQVESCETFESAKSLLCSEPSGFDVLILDRMLRGQDGMDLVRPFRSQNPACRILILSAINTAEEKATALDLGADDYLSKPFSLVELSARLRAMSRRAAPSPAANQVRLKDMILDTVTRQVQVKDRKLDLSNKEFRLLHLFLRNPGRVYNKFEILDAVWDTQFDIESNVVEVTIKNLRRKIEAAQSAVVIESRRNVGYWIEA